MHPTVRRICTHRHRVRRFLVRPTTLSFVFVLFSFVLIDYLLYSWGLSTNVSTWVKPSTKHVSPPSQDGQRQPFSAVILYLISLKRTTELIHSLASLHKNVPMHPWPIILFHTDFSDLEWQAQFKTDLSTSLGSSMNASAFVERIEFEELKWEWPVGLPHNRDAIEPVFADRWPGYHHMCHFFAMDIFTHPRLQNITYYMRMDTDSYISEPLCSDPLEVMHSYNRSYGYRSLSLDPSWVTHGLWPLVSSYARTHRNVERRLSANGWKWPGGLEGRTDDVDADPFADAPFTMYYNNFEIVKLKSFRRLEVRTWLDEIAKDPMRFYKWRWGDAPLRFATVNMFFDVKTEVEQFCNMYYHHQGAAVPTCACKRP